jgi:hypothetical protein
LTINEFDSIWKILEDSSANEYDNGIIIRRVSPDISHDIFLGYEKKTNQKMFLIRVNRKIVSEFQQLPQFSGFDISIINFPDEKPENVMINFSLNDFAYSEIFSTLCEDLYHTAEKEKNQKDMVRLVKERLLMWKQFLDVAGNQGLSPEFQRGLYGELRFLRDVMIQHLGIEKAISTWTGPSKANHDFQIFGISIEVKTSIAKQLQKIQIANEQQLDDTDLRALYIYHLSLRVMNEHGETLPGIIDDIRKLIELQNGPSYEFETQLFKAGYIDKHRVKYKKIGYGDRDIQFFHVDERFPRIIETDLQPGVGDVHYSIDLSVCKQFKESEEDFISELEGIINGQRE